MLNKSPHIPLNQSNSITIHIHNKTRITDGPPKTDARDTHLQPAAAPSLRKHREPLPRALQTRSRASTILTAQQSSAAQQQTSVCSLESAEPTRQILRLCMFCDPILSPGSVLSLDGTARIQSRADGGMGDKGQQSIWQRMRPTHTLMFLGSSVLAAAAAAAGSGGRRAARQTARREGLNGVRAHPTFVGRPHSR